jgi:DNA-nicking Smr family endonuclease
VSSKQRDLRPDERELWRRVTRTLKPRRVCSPASGGAVEAHSAETEGVAPGSAKKTPPPTSRAPRDPLPPQAGEEKRQRSEPPPVADRGAEKRVRRGKLEIGGTLDLHGHTLASGRAALIGFLNAAHRSGDGVVIIVTGKGRVGEGVLKRALPSWLEAREVRPLISGFAQAHRDHGGVGAFYVFLKRGG